MVILGKLAKLLADVPSCFQPDWL
uniref:Uncharacterized protein n=1 Tax=Arundo donax TaxID=35708 RepID=A0A0A9BWH6_ARUDO